jgi:anion-transporting  ArsA/GET3 family ATPase
VWLRKSKLIIVAGKGGVGKTTVSTVTAAAAAELGMRVALVTVDGGEQALRLWATQNEIEPKSLSYEAISLCPGIDARQITPDRALVEWLTDKKLGRLADRLVKTGALDVIATAAPGIRDILVLGRIKALVNEGAYDLVVLDGPASGHAVTFLQSAKGLLDSVSVGAIHQQAKEVADMLANPTMSQCLLVTLPEVTPVNELVETAYALEDRVGISLAGVVVNRLMSPLATNVQATGISFSDDPANSLELLINYRSEREAAQQAEFNRLRRELPLPTFVLPHVDIERAAALSTLTKILATQLASDSV